MFSISEEDLSCPVCCEIFTEPVVLPCSHSFCKECVLNFWEPQDLQLCPVCRTEAPEGEPLVSLVLKNLCAVAIESRAQRQAAQPDCADLCSQHDEECSLYCLEDWLPVCDVCHTYGGHRDHECRPIDEVILDCKERVKSARETLQEKLQTYNTAKGSYEKAELHIQSQTRYMIQHINHEFRALRNFLLDEEEVRVAAVKKEERLKSETVNQKLWDIKAEIETLTDKIRITEEGLETEALPFLQNYEAIMKSAQCSLPDAEMLPGALMDVAGHLGNLSFSVWQKMKGLVKFTPVMLDPNTADSWLSVSGDLTQLTVRDEAQSLPDNPERSTSYQCAWGSQAFSSGVHSWDVLVGGSSPWALGVASETAQRKGKVDISPEEGFWTISLYDGNYTAQTSPFTPLSVKGNPKTIRVQLDWDKGEVSFYDPRDNTHIHTFTHTFTQRVFPYFAHGYIFGPLSIQPSKVSVVVQSN
ncbi:hypothetical protein JZ751_003569 [Albula glossodonta]|uniref:Uncharacterized protein n=1 Tax=Albula glossodonta TaxID=121402 RepID=A0A8T2NDY9_9TELE|nr:hypothetical protein JZ751_003569 [Albula glossodonta]